MKALNIVIQSIIRTTIQKKIKLNDGVSAYNKLGNSQVFLFIFIIFSIALNNHSMINSQSSVFLKHIL
ncbi:unnamed protein product [Paramecium sonneborni]|uniref:Uncharacterized protein n=1 Tax=Paramecium sonneborni TaxID=65129 RepID=A0A8S1N298_9CILI|nr:unnamed protein product [Paramecium sonneborni]